MSQLIAQAEKKLFVELDLMIVKSLLRPTVSDCTCISVKDCVRAVLLACVHIKFVLSKLAVRCEITAQ